MIDKNAKVLIIYTGGTIGMVENLETGTLEPFDFAHLRSQIPEIQKLKFGVDYFVFQPIIDSSNVTPEHWKKLVSIIEDKYNSYDGFVILHGTDTMAYTASALSFMIENVSKPIILTGAQLPIGKLRTDARENLITTLEIAADIDELGKPKIQEVCIFFQNYLFRGNRTTKINADNFNAFKSYNFPFLAKSGINIIYNENILLRHNPSKPVKFHYRLDTNVAVLKIFPGINPLIVSTILNVPELKGVIFETYGKGNAPELDWFLSLLKEASDKGIIIINITQCEIGYVDMSKYQTGVRLKNAGVISGADATVEAALTKMMILLGHNFDKKQIKEKMEGNLCGEITTNITIDDLDI